MASTKASVESVYSVFSEGDPSTARVHPITLLMQKPNGVFNPGLKKFWPKFHWHWTHLRCFSVFSQILVLQIWKIFSSCDRLAIKIICRFKVPRPAFKQRGYFVLFPGFLKILDKWWQHLLSPRFRREYFKWQGAHSREFGAWGQTNRSGKIYLQFFFRTVRGKTEQQYADI